MIRSYLRSVYHVTLSVINVILISQMKARKPQVTWLDLMRWELEGTPCVGLSNVVRLPSLAAHTRFLVLPSGWFRGLFVMSDPPLCLQARWTPALRLQAPLAHLLHPHHSPRPGPGSMPLPHWSRKRLKHHMFPDLRLSPALDQVLGKPPLQSHGPLTPAAGKE